jgi:hypothetical protein
VAAGRGAVARTVIDEVHIQVARVFFALPESNGYVVGGGVAALAHHIVERTTDDLDLFTDRRRVQVRPLAAAEALETAAHDRGWGVDWVRRYPDYARLLVTTEHAPLLVDLALETVELPPTLTVVGPTISEQEVAVGKLIALFDRAEARDFVDVFEFCQRYEPALLLELAVRRDAGLGPQNLAERVRRLTEQLTAADLPAAYQDRFEEIRSFYAEWRAILLG